MDSYRETSETWNKLAGLYQEKFMHLGLYDATYDFICNAIDKKGAKLLDIGCGPGNISRYLVSKRPDFNILGIDIAPNMVALAKANVPSARFEVMDTREIGDLTEVFDGIVCGFCIPYISPQDCVKLISDCSKLLSHQGLIYLSFVEGDGSKSGYQKSSSGDRTYFYYHLSDDLKSALEKNHFQDVRAFEVAYPRLEKEIEMHTILIARKK
jgi:cyclopropane fatty-acyl-phospholipid synthase-like methyltransferase